MLDLSAESLAHAGPLTRSASGIAMGKKGQFFEFFVFL